MYQKLLTTLFTWGGTTDEHTMFILAWYFVLRLCIMLYGLVDLVGTYNKHSMEVKIVRNKVPQNVRIVQAIHMIELKEIIFEEILLCEILVWKTIKKKIKVAIKWIEEESGL